MSRELKAGFAHADLLPMIAMFDRVRRLAEPAALMRASLRHRTHGWALLIAAAVTLLPPGAWSLCLGEAGHVAIEPTASTCTDDHAESNGAEADCGSASHDQCEDYVLLHGEATTVRDSHALNGDVQAVAIAPAMVGASFALVPARVRVFSPPHAPSLSSAPTILRC